MALNGRAGSQQTFLLLKVKRLCRIGASSSQFDPSLPLAG
jgi:hypothetical protein